VLASAFALGPTMRVADLACVDKMQIYPLFAAKENPFPEEK